MKALSLWQPWASLIAHELKRVETRHWTTPYRGLVLIHAAKCWTPLQRQTYRSLCNEHEAVWDAIGRSTPPLGALVAIARLIDVRAMTPAWIDEQTALEFASGDWRPGRFGLVLREVHRLEPVIPMAGRQGKLIDVTKDDVGADAWARLEELVRTVRRS